MLPKPSKLLDLIDPPASISQVAGRFRCLLLCPVINDNRVLDGYLGNHACCCARLMIFKSPVYMDARTHARTHAQL
jgi:hypothetical protein